MGNLINLIPINQQSVSANTKSATSSNKFVSNKYPQVKKYEYQSAQPLTKAQSLPSGISVMPASGELIQENIFQSMASTTKSYAEYIKYFYNAAFRGKGSDYSVGKINDLTIRAGSLGIATVLAGTKLFPFAKGMEFVGLTTWFASMAIWPRIIAAPIKALYGVDINQKYKDSYGRRKNVYDDNKYRLMDIYRHVDVKGRPLSPEKYHQKYSEDYVYLEKIADKLGIPKDIKNRHEATINQMNQIAVQGKTLWMLTAGVMTPVVSSIVADATQKPLMDFISNKRIQKHTQTLNGLEANIDKLLALKDRPVDIAKVTNELGIQNANNLLDKIIPKYADKPLSEAEYLELRDVLRKRYLGTGFYTIIETSLEKDSTVSKPKLIFDAKLEKDLKTISKTVFEKLLSTYPKKYMHYIPSEILNYSGMNDAEIAKLLKNIAANYGDELNVLKTNFLKSGFAEIALDRFKAFKQTKNPDVNDKIERFLDVAQTTMNQEIENYVKENRAHFITKEHLLKIVNFANLGTKLKYKIAQYERATIENVAESLNAVKWDSLPKAYVRALGLSEKELLILASADNEYAGNFLKKKIEELVADPKKYQKIVKKMAEIAKRAMTKEEEHVHKLIGTIAKPGLLFKTKDLMQNLAQFNLGNASRAETEVLYYGQIADIQRKLRNTIDSYSRPIIAMDVFRNIDSVVEYMIGNDKAYEARKSIPDYYMFHKVPYEKAFESTKKYVKDVVLMKNDINSWTTKMETEMSGLKKGLKYSKAMVCSLSDMVFGDLHQETVDMIVNSKPSFLKRSINKVLNKQEADLTTVVDKLRVNNKIMRARYLSIHNPLLSFMTINEPLGGLIHGLRSQDSAKSSAEYLLKILEDKKADLASRIRENGAKLGFDELQNCHKILVDFKVGNAFKDGYEIEKAIGFIKQKGLLDFNSSSTAISQTSGKGVFEFFQSASQNMRSRNKWTKVVYSLLAGSLAVSAWTITNMGKPNSLNSHTYEPKTKNEMGGKE